MEKVLILGATSDIGKFIAFEFAKRKFDLYLTARNKEALAEVTKNILQTAKVQVKEFILDAMDFENHARFVEELPELPRFVVSCFGYYEDPEEAITDFTETWKTIQVNYTANISILNRISEKMKVAKKGGIVVLSSVAGVRGRQKNFLYGSTKSAMTTYLSGLRNRLFTYNVSVTTILLGPVYTRMSEGHDLKPIITAQPEVAARKIVNAALAKKDEIYILGYWKWIMLIIRSIPEFIFKRLGSF